MKRTPAVLTALVSACAWASPASADGRELVWHREILQLEAPQAVTSPLPDGTCRVMLDGFPGIADPGRPALPLRCVSVPVHPGIDWSTLELEVLAVDAAELPGAFDVAPAPPCFIPSPPPAPDRSDAQPLPDGWGPGKHIVAGRDRLVYGADAEYPGAVVKLVGTGQQRTQCFARLRFAPVQYNPVRSTLRAVSAAQVQLRYAYDPAAAPQAAGPLPTQAAPSGAVNAPGASFPPGAAAAGRQRSQVHDLVIITTSHIAANSTRLPRYAAHKTARGFSVLAKTVESIEAEYTMALRPELFETTDERADRIRAFLKDNYLAYGMRYVLLIGNPDPDDPTDPYDPVGDVPMKYCFPDGYHGPTDSYYTDLTGRWDLDGDGRYGEWDGDTSIGGVDLAGYELCVGRIPHYSPELSALDSIFEKIIAYEDCCADQSWKRRCFMPNPIDYSDAYGHEGNTSPVFMAEWIKNTVLIPAGFGYYRIYEHNFTYPPHNVSPPPEQIPENLGYTCFTHYDSSHYFRAGFNVASEHNGDYSLTVLTDDDYATVWSTWNLGPGEFLQFKAVHPDDAWAAYAPYKITIHSGAPGAFPQQFEIHMAYAPDFSDAYLVATETDAAAHAVRDGAYWKLEYVAPATLNTVGGRRYLRLTYTGGSPQTFVQINEFAAYTEEAASIQPYVIPEWQNGYGVVYFNTHGWPQGAAEIISSDQCWQLDDTRPGFVFSKACSTAFPEAADNLCAQLLRQGGIAACGATRVSYGWGDHGYQLFMPRLIRQNKPFGDVLSEVRAEMQNSDWYGWGGLYFDALRFNLYGDPTLRLITATPGDTDGDGDVDLGDLATLLAAYGACSGEPGYSAAADFDASGCVDLADLALLLSHYGTGC